MAMAAMRIAARPAAPPRSPDVSTLVDDDRQEPRSQRHARSELAELAPCPGDRLLGGVLCFPTVSEHRLRKPQRGFDEGTDQGFERRLITGDGLLEKRVHRVDAQSLGHI
jgi:hypothetical protein